MTGIQSRPPVQDRQLYLYLQRLASQIDSTEQQSTSNGSGVTALRNELLAEIGSLRARVSALEAAIEEIDNGADAVDIEAVLAAATTQTPARVSELAEAPLSAVVFAQSELAEAALSGVQAAERDEVSGTYSPAAVEALGELVAAPYPE